MQWEPKSLAGRTPFHFAAGCGGCQRRLPTGGAAKGMPLTALILWSVVNRPSTLPLSVLICRGFEALAGSANRGSTKTIVRRDLIGHRDIDFSPCPNYHRNSIVHRFTSL